MAKKTTAKSASAAAEKTNAGSDQVEKKIDQEQDQGYRGTKVDPTPNENYTVDGVTSGKATPETDEKARAKAREAAGIL